MMSVWHQRPRFRERDFVPFMYLRLSLSVSFCSLVLSNKQRNLEISPPISTLRIGCAVWASSPEGDDLLYVPLNRRDLYLCAREYVKGIEKPSDPLHDSTSRFPKQKCLP